MGEAGLSPTEVGKEIGEHHRHHGDEAGWGRALVIAEALLLAVVAVLAAWSGYASAKWGTESRVLLSEASTARIEASESRLDADSQRNFDEEAFGIWFGAFASGNDGAAELAEQLFTPNLAAAVDAWLALDPVNDPDAPSGPTRMPGYEAPGVSEAEELDGRADERFAEGEDAAFTADDYIRTTLYLATVLFLVGISGHFRLRAARLGLVGVGLAITIFAAAQILSLPTPP